MDTTILIIDDDTLLRRSLAFNLERSGFSVSTAGTAEDGLLVAGQSRPDLILLDIGLPGMDGLDALRRLRDQMGIPVIFLTARRRELDEALGLELGADDYVTKPFDLNVLIAHIKAVLRRAHSEPAVAPSQEIIQVGGLIIDPSAHVASLNGRNLDLSPKEFLLLNVLVENAGKLVTNEELLTRVWGAEYEGQPQVVYVHIRWLREKIEEDPMKPVHIQTVRKYGYRYMP